MTNHILKENISTTLEAIVEQTASLMEYQTTIPQIEIDITLAHIRDLYKAIYDLNKQITDKPVIEEIPHTPPTEPTKPAIEKIIKEVIVEEVIISEMPASPIEELIIKSEATSTPDLFSAPTIPEEPIKVEAKKSILEPKKSIFEQAAETKSEIRMSDKIQKNISSIKQAIGINEKYQFMNVLFKGNQDDYNSIISSIDSCSSLADVKNLIADSTIKYSWTETNELQILQKLQELIDRKYTT